MPDPSPDNPYNDILDGVASPASPASASWAIAASIFGSLTEGYAGFHQQRLRRYELQSQESALGHRERMLDLDRRSAERQAMQILGAGQDEIARITLEGGQRRAEARNRAAGRGLLVEDAREAELSEQIIQDIDVYTVRVSAARQAAAARTRSTALQNEQLFSRTSRRNLRSTRASLRPEDPLLQSLFSGASDISRIGAARSRP